MKTKDFINIGVFTAIYFVVLFGFGMLGVINPAM
ncbi:MptD family putative ECF transporter S component, partial [Actinotignum timonense]